MRDLCELIHLQKSNSNEALCIVRLIGIEKVSFNVLYSI